MGSTLSGGVKHMACRSGLTWAFPGWRCSINHRDPLLLIDGLPARSGLNVGQTAEGYVSFGQEVIGMQGIKIYDLPGMIQKCLLLEIL